MNLAQLIDPQWAREGSPHRFALVRPLDIPAVPATARKVVAHEMLPGTRLARVPTAERTVRGKVILAVLTEVERIGRAEGRGASLEQIARRLDRKPENTSGSVRNYFDQGYLERSGGAYRYRYTLTDKGRQHLQAMRDA